MKPILKIITGFIILSFIGIKYEPEFREPDFFFKHKPNLKFEYFSPLSGSDNTLEDLNFAKRKEEIFFREFVGNYYDRGPLDDLLPFAIPLMSLLFPLGLMQFFGLVSKTWSWKKYLFGYVGSFLVFCATFSVYWSGLASGPTMISFFWFFSILNILFLERWKWINP